MSTLFEALQLDIVLFAVMEMLPDPINAGRLPHFGIRDTRYLPSNPGNNWGHVSRRKKLAPSKRNKKFK